MPFILAPYKWFNFLLMDPFSTFFPIVDPVQETLHLRKPFQQKDFYGCQAGLL
jgi:hypothetical protein